MNRIQGQILIQRPPEVVFNFVTTFGTWPDWYPITQRVSGAIDHPCEPGETCQEDVTLFLVPFTFYWTVQEKDFPRRFLYTGTSNAGGHATITYQFTPRNGGTLFDRELAYEQTRPFMKFMDWFCIRHHIQEVSDRAIENAKAILESQADQDA